VQTTISRDVHELGLVKVRAPSGRLVYATPGGVDADRRHAIGVAMCRYATGVERAGPLVVVTTPSGYASALAQALDEGAHPGIASATDIARRRETRRRCIMVWPDRRSPV